MIFQTCSLNRLLDRLRLQGLTTASYNARNTRRWQSGNSTDSPDRQLNVNHVHEIII